MRDLNKVISDILEVIPKPEEDLIIKFKWGNTRKCVRYSALN